MITPHQSLSFSFGEGFLADHAGHIMTDPRIAVVELVANSYDAGATRVEITWPDEVGGRFEVADNGCGMTADEFERRWKRFNYNRTIEQGPRVEFPPTAKGVGQRMAFGQSGKGRHGAFCFADNYHAETWRGGTVTTASIVRLDGPSGPFAFQIEEHAAREGHGTRIWADVERNLVAAEQIAETIGSKFLVDPSLTIALNGRELALCALSDLDSVRVPVPGYGELTLHKLVSPEHDRTTRLRGITWWVQGRRVGEPTWEVLAGEPILDRRASLAKRLSFVVEADFLKQDVRGDWTGFFENRRTGDAREIVHRKVMDAVGELQASSRSERKREVIVENSNTLNQLPTVSRRAIGQFVDAVQEQCSSITTRDLGKTVQILANLEKSRSRYDLLRQLSVCSPDDLDRWNRLIRRWSSSEAQVILGELELRLSLIKQLEKLVNVPTTDELHTLQPLFARGLWMFGPEYEAVEYTSNRYLVHTIREHLGGIVSQPANLRTDIVAVPDGSLGIYSADAYEEEGGEVNGYRKVMVIELKRGGFTLTVKELHQGQAYAAELRKAARVQPHTDIMVYVLGAEAEISAREDLRIGDHTIVRPMRFDDLLRRAESRTFNLKQKIEAITPAPETDLEVEAALTEAALQPPLFGDES